MTAEPNKSTPTLLTIKKASGVIGVEYRQLLEAVKEGIVPSYRLRQSRHLVKIDEIVSVMKSHGNWVKQEDGAAR